MTIQKRNTLAAALLLVGMSQMLGAWMGIDWLRGLGAATAAAPYPKVFSDVDGLETFASRFDLFIADDNGGWESIPMDSALYSQVGGSYNRRNVYGAALSYGPRLPEAIWREIFAFGLAEGGPLRRELGLPETGDIVVRIATRTRGRDDVWILAIDAAAEATFQQTMLTEESK